MIIDFPLSWRSFSTYDKYLFSYYKQRVDNRLLEHTGWSAAVSSVAPN